MDLSYFLFGARGGFFFVLSSSPIDGSVFLIFFVNLVQFSLVFFYEYSLSNVMSFFFDRRACIGSCWSYHRILRATSFQILSIPSTFKSVFFVFSSVVETVRELRFDQMLQGHVRTIFFREMRGREKKRKKSISKVDL